MSHITQVYDDFTDSGSLSSTCVRQINLLSNLYTTTETLDDEDIIYDVDDAARMTALLVLPDLVGYDTGEVMHDIQQMFDLLDVDREFDNDIPDDPFLIIAESEIILQMEEDADRLKLYALMVDVISKFVRENFHVETVNTYLYCDALMLSENLCEVL